MDITNFVVSARNQALLYGDHTTYHQLLAKKLHNSRKKLNIVNKNRSKYTKRGPVTAEQIAENHEYNSSHYLSLLHFELLTMSRFLHLVLLTAERAWAHAMRLKAAHSTDTKGITGRSRSHIISRLDKGARAAEHLVQILPNASTTDILEARAYAFLLRGATDFEKRDWTLCLKNYSAARIIYNALMTSMTRDIFKDLLSETIDPSIRYAAYQSKVPRTLSIPAIAKKAFPSSDDTLVSQINEVAPNLLRQSSAEAEEGQAAPSAAPQTITWRSREVKIEDASIALALASADTATARLAEKLTSSDVVLPKEMASAYDELLIASQDAADATKHAIDELREEGVSQSDPRIQSLQITRTAVNYQMISLRIGRNRVLSGEHDGALLDSAPNTTRKSKKEASARKPKIEPPGRRIARLKEKVVLYDATLQSIESIKELPGIAADEQLLQQLEATAKYFHALKCLSIARSHSLLDQSTNALALTKHAYDQCQQSVVFFSKNGASSSESPILNIEIRQTDIEFLGNLLRGELQRSRAIVEIDNLKEKVKAQPTKAQTPLVYKLQNLVEYPPKIHPIPVKPLFFDVAWNYIDYPGRTPAAAAVAEADDQPTTAAAPEPKKRGCKRPDQQPDFNIQQTVSPCLFLISILSFFVAALALGFGLDAIPHDRLINTEEMELRTNFTQSRKPQIRPYVFNITQALAAPDGFQKPMILANGQSPGPLIEANTGDTIRVQVNNLMPNSSTTLHWHGIDQKNSTWMDGVNGVSQCGIPPGQSFTYEFRVDGQRGTFWWHAHLSVQYSDGLYGPIVIHDPEEMVPEADDEKIIFVGDVYHTYGSILLESYLKPASRWVTFESGVEPLPDNILMNGQNEYNCSVISTTFPPSKDQKSSSSSFISANPSQEVNCTGGQLYRTKIRSGQRVRLRLINASSFLSYWFSIDNHTMTIIELDGIEIEPLTSQRGVYLNIGQRVSVIVEANAGTPGNYYIRATLPQTCFLPYAPYTSSALASAGYAVRGILSYDDTPLDAEPIGVAGNVSNPYGVENNDVRGDVWEGCDDMPFDMPRPMRQIPAYEVAESNMHFIEYAFRQAQDVNRIFINKTAYAPLTGNATLWKAINQNFSTSEDNSYNSWDFGLDQQVLLVPEANKGAQIVINSLDVMEHPWHLHNTSTTIWNLDNPMRRDTVTIPAYSHIVLRFAADNPGLWALHCHVAWHMEGSCLPSFY
ncbi:hypothetical protein F5Y16DRAFT_410518 [Xylariaceae sp. FL0255]|nr:hypothetical protein F5Y16DRAFT_410518 [Xylariaceae sp. FL0255]